MTDCSVLRGVLSWLVLFLVTIILVVVVECCLDLLTLLWRDMARSGRLGRG